MQCNSDLVDIVNSQLKCSASFLMLNTSMPLFLSVTQVQVILSTVQHSAKRLFSKVWMIGSIFVSLAGS